MSLEAERMYPVDEKGTFGQRDRQHVETFPETNLHLTNDSIHTKVSTLLKYFLFTICSKRNKMAK